MPTTPRATTALLLMLIGGTGFAAAWVVAAGTLDTHGAWLAPLGAADVAWMLHLGRMPAGAKRAVLAVAGSVATILLANWGIAAMEIGRSMGLLPWESALRLGSSYAWELIRLANNAIELAWYALSVFVAAIGGLSGRRPAP